MGDFFQCLCGLHVHLATFIFGLVFVVISPILATSSFFLSCYALLVSRAIGTVSNVFILLGNHLPVGIFYMVYLILNAISVFIELIFIAVLLLASFGMVGLNGFTGLFLAPFTQTMGMPLLIVLVIMTIVNIYSMTQIILTWLQAFESVLAQQRQSQPLPAEPPFQPTTKISLRTGESEETLPLSPDSARTVFL